MNFAMNSSFYKINRVIPTHERDKQLSLDVKSALVAADNPVKAIEIVVSDNANNDPTPQVLANFTNQIAFANQACVCNHAIATLKYLIPIISKSSLKV